MPGPSEEPDYVSKVSKIMFAHVEHPSPNIPFFLSASASGCSLVGCSEAHL